MKLTWAFGIAGALAIAAGTAAGPAPATRPGTVRAAEGTRMLRQVEVPLLGKVADIKGMPAWPDDPEGRWRSWSVEEPCDLTVRLPSGKTLNIRTRPILIVSKEKDVVVTVRVPPAEAKEGWIADQAKLIEKLLTEWQAVPSRHMQALINEFKAIPPPEAHRILPHAGIERVGFARLDDDSAVTFELVVGHPGTWNLVAVFEAGDEVRKRNQREAESQIRADTQPIHGSTSPAPATRPATVPAAEGTRSSRLKSHCGQTVSGFPL